MNARVPRQDRIVGWSLLLVVLLAALLRAQI